MNIFRKITVSILAASILLSATPFVSQPTVFADEQPRTFYVDGIEYNDQDGIGGFVSRLYRVALDRVYDESGIIYWTCELANYRRTGLDVALGFFDSDEILNSGLSDEAFLQRAYGTLFDRAPDAEGLAFWLQKLAGGESRLDIIREFGYSVEWANTCVSYGIISGANTPATVTPPIREGLRTFVTSLYADCMNREPDQEGIDHWCGKLARMEISGREAAAFFFSSSEFRERAQTLTNEELIQVFYKVFMNRVGDSYGLEYWLDLMSWGGGISELFEGFSNAPEFEDKCHSYGINPGDPVSIPSEWNSGVESEFLDFAFYYSDAVELMNTVELHPRTTYNLINVRTADTIVSEVSISEADLAAIREFAAAHFKPEWTAAQKALYTIWWLNQNITYGNSRGGYAVSAFRYRTGQCNVYNGALVEMLVYLGFDASLIYGYRGRSWENRWDHFWGEIYIDGETYVMESGNYNQSGYWMFFCDPYGYASKYIKNCVVQG